MNCNVLEYGAVPSIENDNAAAFQAAVDACAAAGGGRVNVPAGAYGLKKVNLRDNVELHLEAGAVLHSLLRPVPQEGVKCKEPSANTREYLVGGIGVHNVAITGLGRIDGRGYDVFWPKNDGYEHPLYGQRYWPQLHRPKGLVHFRESTDIVLRDITIADPPCYNVWLLGCDRIDISHVRIDADVRGPNDDGIDLDCCSNARVSGCDIICGDDGIALKSDIHELGFDKACENIVISDCRISTTSDGIRIGYEGDGAIRNVTVSNCVIYDTMIGISMMVAISYDDPRGTDIYKGPAITDVTFENMVINSFQTFNFQYCKTEPSQDKPIQGYLDRIFFRNIIANATRGSYLGGDAEQLIRDIEFSGLRMTLSGEMGPDFVKEVPEPYPLWSDLPYSGLPYPFFVRNAREVRIYASTFAWENATGCWQPTVFRGENANVVLEDIRLVNPPPEEDPVIFPVGDIDGIPYFEPPVGFDEASEMRRVVEFCNANAEDLGKINATPKCHIEASFIYAHPADYKGMPMLNASSRQWKEVFSRLRAMHVGTVIFQASLWRELKECYYKSSRYGFLKCYSVLERMFEAAESENMRVYLGGYGSVAGWKNNMTQEALRQELAEHKACFEEIRKLGRIEGMYFPSETSFKDRRLPERERRMRTLYNGFADIVKGYDSSLKIIVSPATQHKPEDNPAFMDFWNAILQGTGIDILMPQDSVGTNGCLVRNIPQIWQAWKSVADANAIQLWAHIELFERRGFSKRNSLYPASTERIAAQLALTEPYVTGRCCWEAQYFASELAGPDGLRLQNFLKGL